MYKVVHRSQERGTSANGSRKGYYTFSYGNYYAEDRINFGVMRVFNEEIIDGGGGYDATHHDNMEIIMLPLSGSFEYGDNLGNNTSVAVGQAQILSAGTGIVHNLYNSSLSDTSRYLQIWIYPREYDCLPDYTKVRLADAVHGQWREVASPKGSECVLPVEQNVWISTTELNAGDTIIYGMQDADNGVYLSVLSGEVEVLDTMLARGDGMGVCDHGEVLKIEAKAESEILLIELPMQRAAADR